MSQDHVISSPNLEYSRKQAKALHKAVTANEPSAISRVQSHLNVASKAFLLADAQWIIARESGFPSWPKFKQFIESIATEVIPEPSVLTPATQIKKLVRGATIGTDAVFAKTGKHWVEWFKIFDDAGCPTKNHQEIVEVASANGAASWWQQMIAIHYEKERGIRDTNMNCNGEYNVGVSKTLDSAVEVVYKAWVDDVSREKWLQGKQLTFRKSVPSKRVLITWTDGSNVVVNFYEKPNLRCQCTVEHLKLSSLEDVSTRREFWKNTLDRLRDYLG